MHFVPAKKWLFCFGAESGTGDNTQPRQGSGLEENNRKDRPRKGSGLEGGKEEFDSVKKAVNPGSGVAGANP